ncbi:MAG: Holliday junction resolvase RuvX [Gammaproteobacteria bacterium]|nr:Holliday junction resolvase RuvX [Gammaproteobacteria bacterium]MCD8542134.1 Holliday junction resolvase RuvX [Gammaproteobacteria bacterium]
MSHHYLGFDFGVKYIGVAVGQDVTRTARPLKTLKQFHGVVNWTEIKKLVKEWSPKALIVGIPYGMNKKNDWITEAAIKFSKDLALETACPVHMIDERLTTIEAREVLFDQGGHKALVKEAIDAMAAKVMLQTWLENQ